MSNRRTCLCRGSEGGRERRLTASRSFSDIYGLLRMLKPAEFLVNLDPEKVYAVDAGNDMAGLPVDEICPEDILMPSKLQTLELRDFTKK